MIDKFLRESDPLRKISVYTVASNLLFFAVNLWQLSFYTRNLHLSLVISIKIQSIGQSLFQCSHLHARLFPFRSSFPDIHKASLVGGYGTIIIIHVFIICGSSISNNGERQQQQQQGQRQKQQRTTATSAGGEREKEEGG